MRFYAVQRARGPAEEPLESIDRPWDSLAQARDLWSLVDERRAAEIERFIKREGAMLPSEVKLDRAKLDEIVGLLDGLEPALGNWIDAEGKLPVDQLDELAKRLPSLNLARSRGIDRPYAAEEALSAVLMLTSFLRRARDADLDVISG
ncbi:MAG: hypothetical protein HOV81_35625 [Kofleriaceae bacterium]|nr:hypothetical protein [Kofleriaceae bacterium]